MYNLYVYEWDEAKRKSNMAKHDLDFADAHLVYENPAKVTLPTTYSIEKRWQDVAVVETHGATLALIYRIRDNTVRVLSFRRASRKERNAYEADKLRSAVD